MKNIIVAAAVLAAAPAFAATSTFTGAMSGGLAGAGFGFGANSLTTGAASISINTSTSMLSYSYSWAGLTSNASSAGLQCCSAINQATGPLAVVFSDFVGGSMTGSFSGMVDLTQASAYDAGFLAANGGTAAGAYTALLAGLNSSKGYGMVYSTFANGQPAVRGLVAAVPEPGTYALLALGLGLVALRARKQTS